MPEVLSKSRHALPAMLHWIHRLQKEDIRMTWSTLWPQNRKPSPDDIAEFVDNPLWKALCSWLESGYRTVPRIEYSRCGMAPGWNVKYKKGGRALCTLYPAAGSFTCLVCIGQREAMAAEALLPLCSPPVRQLYHTASPLNGSRWLMIPVTDEAVLTDVKALIGIRAAA